MAMLDEYIDLIGEVSIRKGKDNTPATGSMSGVNGWSVRRWEWATRMGNGFQGAIFANATTGERVVAYAGTLGNPITAPQGQISADARMIVNVIPNIAGSANTMFGWAQQETGNGPVTVIGYSLGGSLAQIVGQWNNCRFISFAGPGMATHISMSAVNILKPMQMLRTRRAATRTAAGFNYRIMGDRLAAFGTPIGTPRDYAPRAGTGNLHTMQAFQEAIPRGQLLADPFA